MSRGLRSDAGLSLVEALVSLFVFALLSAGAGVVLSQAMAIQSKIGAAHASLRGVQTAQTLLAADLLQLSFRSQRDEFGTLRRFIVTEGRRPSFSFVRAVATDVMGPGVSGARAGNSGPLVSVIYFVDSDGRLIRRTAPTWSAPPGNTATDKVILEGAMDLSFQFHDGAGWVDRWIAPDTPPRAVAIVATMPRYGRIRLEAASALS